MQNRFQLKLVQFFVFISCVFIGAFSRILPHPANVTAMTSLSFISGREFSKIQTLLLVIFSLLISDITLSYINHTAIFGTWSLFTYSGFIGIALLGSHLNKIKSIYIPFFIAGSSLSYWLWSNLGTWLFSGLYTKSFSGLVLCYVNALPFLRNAILGDLFWMVILLCVFLLPTAFSKIFPGRSFLDPQTERQQTTNH